MTAAMPEASLPDAFLDSLSELGDKAGVLREALLTAPSVSIRENRRKPSPDYASMDIDGVVPWCAVGRYLSSRPSFTLDPSMHQGRYYVQDASSMFLSHVVNTLVGDSAAPLLALDACAAPGGKTTALIDALPDGSVVVANEYVPKRAAILKENIIKWGYPGVVVTRDDTARIARACHDFDVVVADVPCSGEGMMRKDKTAVEQWSPALVDECVARQCEIVANLWDAVAHGGYLIYSTCTFNRKENELMVEHMVRDLGAESVRIPVEPDWNITPGIDTSCHCYRFLPGLTRGEGLFMAVLRKPGEAERGKGLACRGGKKPAGKKASRRPSAAAVNVRDVAAAAAKWLSRDGGYELTVDEGRVNAVPGNMSALSCALGERLNVIHHGVCVGEIKGGTVIPSQSLAMSQALSIDAFPRVELSREAALDYLRREALTLPDGTPKGFVLVCYESYPLGFVKNLGSRANNLYPSEWRVLTKKDS